MVVMGKGSLCKQATTPVKPGVAQSLVPVQGTQVASQDATQQCLDFLPPQVCGLEEHFLKNYGAVQSPSMMWVNPYQARVSSMEVVVKQLPH